MIALMMMHTTRSINNTVVVVVYSCCSFVNNLLGFGSDNDKRELTLCLRDQMCTNFSYVRWTYNKPPTEDRCDFNYSVFFFYLNQFFCFLYSLLHCSDISHYTRISLPITGYYKHMQKTTSEVKFKQPTNWFGVIHTHKYMLHTPVDFAECRCCEVFTFRSATIFDATKRRILSETDRIWYRFESDVALLSFISANSNKHGNCDSRQQKMNGTLNDWTRPKIPRLSCTRHQWIYTPLIPYLFISESTDND